MKLIIINGSPRTKWNTAMLLKEAEKGAKDNNIDVEYIDLYSIKFLGCRSCLACKLKGKEENYKCKFKDELTPILNKILEADKIIIGSPIYFSEPTSSVRALLERLTFPMLSYINYQSIYKGKIDVDIILTMNAPKEIYENRYKINMDEYFNPFKLLNGNVRIFPIYDTLQVNDYSKYDMDLLRGEHKKKVREKDFPSSLEFLYKLGKGEI